jgi:hypothetical protein
MTFWRRLLALSRRGRLDAELRDEMAQHVAWKTESLESQGIPHGEAARRARKESLVLEIAGAALGVPAAYALGQAAEASLFGVSPASPALLGAAVSAGAAIPPARRASGVDPLVALRAD